MTNIYYTINPISIGGNTIERVVVYKLLLGVYISNDLKWIHQTLYSLRVFKQCGAPPACQLAKVLVTIVRPILE